MTVQLWMIFAAVVLVFLVVMSLLFLRALFRTKVLQWAKHQKGQVRQEAQWVWRIALVLTVIIGVGEYMKLGNPLVMTSFGNLTYIGLVLFVLGLFVLLKAMDARKQYLWYFQVLAPGEKLPPYSTNGIYSVVRNPRDLGVVLVLAGVAASLMLKFALAFVVLFFIATIARVNSRDRLLMEKYGKEYADYASKTRKLIPYVY